MQQDNTDTSVLISLCELAALEDERLREEQNARERARAQAEQAERRARERRQAEEQARRAAEQEAARARELAIAEQEARCQALVQAEIVRARVAVEAAAQLELAEAQRRHQLELARLAHARSARRMRMGLLAAALAALLGGGAAAAQGLAAPTTALRPLAAEAWAVDAAGTAEKQLARQHRRQRLARADAKHAELSRALGAIAKPGDALARAARRVKEARAAVNAADPEDARLDELERALGELAEATEHELAAAQPTPKRWAPPPTGTPETEPPCDFHDPMCGRLPGL